MYERKITRQSLNYTSFRVGAYKVLSFFDTDETKKVLNDFKEKSDSIDNKVIELGDYFIKKINKKLM